MENRLEICVMLASRVFNQIFNLFKFFTMKKLILFSAFVLTGFAAQANNGTTTKPKVLKVINTMVKEVNNCTTTSDYNGKHFTITTATCAEGLAAFKKWKAEQ
jgi:hypothetical protein